MVGELRLGFLGFHIFILHPIQANGLGAKRGWCNLQLPDPDIAKTYRVTVILQTDRRRS